MVTSVLIVVFIFSLFQISAILRWIRSLLRPVVTPALRAAMKPNSCFLRETSTRVMAILFVGRQQVGLSFPGPLSFYEQYYSQIGLFCFVFSQLRFSDASIRECYFSFWAIYSVPCWWCSRLYSGNLSPRWSYSGFCWWSWFCH